MRIDFIAGHSLLAQAAQSVHQELQGRSDCQWHIGRPIKPTGAAAAVLVDHVHHHPDFNQWPKRFYLLHDLGDIDVYKKERAVLRQCTAVIVPDKLHAQRAQRYVARRWWRHGTTVFTGGWPKYDEATYILPALPKRSTILYAVSWAGENEWKRLLPALARLPVNVIIKNHPYATAPGEEVSEYYQHSREAVAAMETLAAKLNMLVLPRDLNICTLFPHVQAVISDQSSVLAEFLPWGPSFETGANPNGRPRPEISRWYPRVTFWPLKNMLADIEKGGAQLLGKITNAGPHPGPERGAGKKIADFIWERLCA